VPIQVYRKNFLGPRDSLNLQVQARNGVADLDAATDEVRALLRAARHTGFRDPDPSACSPRIPCASCGSR